MDGVNLDPDLDLEPGSFGGFFFKLLLDRANSSCLYFELNYAQNKNTHTHTQDDQLTVKKPNCWLTWQTLAPGQCQSYHNSVPRSYTSKSAKNSQQLNLIVDYKTVKEKKRRVPTMVQRTMSNKGK